MAEDQECGNDDSLWHIAYVHSTPVRAHVHAQTYILLESHFILEIFSILLELLGISWSSIWNNAKYLYHSFSLSNHRKIGEMDPRGWVWGDRKIVKTNIIKPLT